MRNLILTFVLLTLGVSLDAQRFGYVDTDFILQNLPQYNQAQQTLQNQTKQWNKEIQNRQAALEQKQADFLNEKVLLTEEQIKSEQEEINFELEELKKLQEKRYGQEGDLIRLRKSIVKPIQDQIWIAVKQVAEKRNYGFIFDKGSDLIMVYTDPKFDISREVLLLMNPDAPSLKKEDNKSSSGSSSAQSNTSNNRNSTGKKTSGKNSRTSNSKTTGSKTGTMKR